MHVVSVNIGLPRSCTWKGRTFQTAIAKEAVTGRVAVGPEGLAGDGVADRKNHGAPHQAVYVYPQENYAHWREELGRDGFAFGQFGENLTVAGLTEADACIGDRYRVGTALLEVSQPRIPCYKQDMHLGEDGFAKRFLESRRVGYYFRVIEPGEVAAGDGVACEHRAPEGITVRDVVEMRFFDGGDPARLEWAAAVAALSPGWREALAKRAAGA